jgi:hypothetical protein
VSSGIRFSPPPSSISLDHKLTSAQPRGSWTCQPAAHGKGLFADPDRTTVLGAAKVPFFNRDTLAVMLGLSPATSIIAEVRDQRRHDECRVRVGPGDNFSLTDGGRKLGV